MKKLKDYQRTEVNYAYLGNYKAVALTYYGSRLLLDTRNIQHMRIITHGCYEPSVAWAIEKHLKSGDTMIDVGTNLGYFTLLGCKTVGPKGKVIGFEANPDIFHIMESSVFANSFRTRCETHNLAVFNKESSFEFTWDSAGHGGGRLLTNDEHRKEENTATVNSVTLDDYIQKEDYPISVIKIDTEGSDPFVIDGARNLLASNPGCVVITEWSPRFMQSRGFPVEDAVKLLQETFSSISLIERIGVTRRLDPTELFDIKHGNLMLVV